MSIRKVRCLIVDDEPIAREIIERFILQTERLELIGSCEDALDALNIIQRGTVDILFSDIQMPRINGLELVRSLPNPPTIVFITAYDQFAVESYQLNIADYLVKPVSYSRFLQAVNKSMIFIDLAEKKIPYSVSTYFFVKSNNRIHKVEYSDILYVESLKDYVKIHTSGSSLIVYSSLKSFEEKLPSDLFFRIHQSYVIALKHVKSLSRNTIEMTNKVSLPLSKSRKTELYDIFNLGNDI